MRWLWALFLVPALALAGNSDVTEFSGVEVYRFRNGVYPDASYTGMILQQINQKAKTTAHTTYTFAALGDTVGSARKRALWKCDISAIPDSAVIVSARLRLLVSTATTSGGFRVQGYRIMLPWTSGATWNTRGTSPDSSWTSNNAAAASANWGLADSMGSAVNRGTSVTATLDDRSRWPIAGSESGFTEREGGGYYTAAGFDSIYSGTGIASSGSLARMSVPVFDRAFTISSPTNDTCWISVNITDAVRKWHSHQWANHGLVLTAVGIDARDDSSFDYDANSLLANRLKIVAPPYSYHNLYSRRPMLVVKILTATGPDTVLVNGRGGRSTIGG